jgi:hypothetical protein
MAGKINRKQLDSQIFNNKAVKELVADIVAKNINSEKGILIENFINHPVTQELQSGESSENISGTLDGYGNLFSFIGFNNGTNPVSPVLNLLNKISISRNIQYKNGKYKFQINVPSKQELFDASKMPWETGRSWLFDMEKTISGLGAYLYGQFETSRSETGIELKRKIFNRAFRRVKYFGTMYNIFNKKLSLK